MKFNTGNLRNRVKRPKMPNLVKLCIRDVPTLVVFPKPLSDSFLTLNVEMCNPERDSVVKGRLLNCYVINEAGLVQESWLITSSEFMTLYVDLLYACDTDYVAMYVTRNECSLSSTKALYVTRNERSLSFTKADISDVNIEVIEEYIDSFDEPYEERLPDFIISKQPAIEAFREQIINMSYIKYNYDKVEDDPWDYTHRYVTPLCDRVSHILVDEFSEYSVDDVMPLLPDTIYDSLLKDAVLAALTVLKSKGVSIKG